MTAKVPRLRWRLDPRETGLRAITAPPRGSTLRGPDGMRYATIQCLRGGRGWFWVAGWESQVPHMNTANRPNASADEAKAEAMAYVNTHLAKGVAK